MKQQEEEIKRNISNIACNALFESPVTMNLQKKDQKLSLERRLAAGILEEMAK